MSSVLIEVGRGCGLEADGKRSGGRGWEAACEVQSRGQSWRLWPPLCRGARHLLQMAMMEGGGGTRL